MFEDSGDSEWHGRSALSSSMRICSVDWIGWGIISYLCYGLRLVNQHRSSVKVFVVVEPENCALFRTSSGVVAVEM